MRIDYNYETLSGPKSCFPDGLQNCFIYAKRITGNKIRVQKTGNIITCQEICMDDEQCLFWTYFYDRRRCNLHTSTDGGFVDDAWNAISAPKTCKPLHEHKSKNLNSVNSLIIVD